MLLHKQKSLYHLSDDEKSDLMDMILVAINEVTKFNPNESDGSRYIYCMCCGGHMCIRVEVFG